MKLEKHINDFINDWIKYSEIDAIFLSGSKTGDYSDQLSDYDFYFYLNSHFDKNKREIVLKKHCSYFELNNQFWETEDNGTLVNGDNFDIIYRNFDFLDNHLENLLFNFNVSVGYSTCIWNNLENSEIIFDRYGKGKIIKEKYKISYPDKLSEKIIEKNLPLLSGTLPAYDKQIEKAIKRKDIISVNHRIAAFLASYFDILFALNKMSHPGEKRIIQILKESATILPRDFEQNLNKILNSNPLDDIINKIIVDIVVKLKVLL